MKLAGELDDDQRITLLKGIGLIAQYHDQLAIGYGAELPEAFFRGIKDALQHNSLCYIAKNNLTTITFVYNKETQSWFYEVSTMISLKQENEFIKKISDITHRFKVTPDGFQLIFLDYSNTLISKALEHHTPFDAFRFMLSLTKGLATEVRKDKLSAFLTNQGFSFSDWYTYFSTILKNKHMELKTGEPKDVFFNLVFRDDINLEKPDNKSSSKNFESVFLTALYQTYAKFPRVDTKILASQMQPTHNMVFDTLRLTINSLESEQSQETKKRLLLDFLNKKQAFPFHQWHNYFLIELKKNITAPIRFREFLKEKSSADLFCDLLFNNTIDFKKLDKQSSLSDLEIAFFTALYQTYATLSDVNNEILASQMLTSEITKKMNAPFSITTSEGCEFKLYSPEKDLKKLEQSYNEMYSSSRDAARYSTIFAPTQPKEKKDEKSNRSALYQLYYETRKSQVIDALPHMAADDGMLLLDELFSLQEALRAEDKKIPQTNASSDRITTLFEEIQWDKEALARIYKEHPEAQMIHQTAFFTLREALTDPDSPLSHNLESRAKNSPSDSSSSSSAAATTKK